MRVYSDLIILFFSLSLFRVGGFEDDCVGCEWVLKLWVGFDVINKVSRVELGLGVNLSEGGGGWYHGTGGGVTLRVARCGAVYI
jgi:hypothetical protein